MTDALVAFLKARLDDDEHWALTVSLESRPETWEPDHENGAVLTVAGKQVATGTRHSINDLEHIARQDPARTLREIKVKRQLLDEHQNVNDGSCGTCVDGKWGYPTHGGSVPQSYPCRTLRLLALPYSDHPEYEEAWRP